MQLVVCSEAYFHDMAGNGWRWQGSKITVRGDGVGTGAIMHRYAVDRDQILCCQKSVCSSEVAMHKTQLMR
jgi:hypothetical protein